MKPLNLKGLPLGHDDWIAKHLVRHERQNARLALALALLEREPVLHELFAEVALKHKTDVDELLRPCRFKDSVDAVHEFYYRALTETLASAVLVGKIAARDHSSVLYGSARHADINNLPLPRGADGGKYFRYKKFYQSKRKDAEQHGT